MNGLDPGGIRVLNDVIQEISKAGTAIIISSHLLSILEEVCTKVLVLDHGKKCLYGTVEEIKVTSKSTSLEEIFFYATKKAA